MNLLITGGSGFLGSKLAIKLASLGHNISLILRPTSSLKRIEPHAENFLICRAINKTMITNFVCKVKPDIVIHTACLYGRNGESLLELVKANYLFGHLIIDALLQTNRPVSFINTATALDPNDNFYSLTKHQFSQTGHRIATAQGISLRFINVLLQHMYGPWDDETKFTTRVLTACYNNEIELNLTEGTQIRDFIFIDDIISAYIAIVDNLERFGPSQDLHLGSGIATTVREFVETAHRVTSSSTKLNFGVVPFRAKEPMCSIADISMMKSLGWMPKFDIESGIIKTLQAEFELCGL